MAKNLIWNVSDSFFVRRRILFRSQPLMIAAAIALAALSAGALSTADSVGSSDDTLRRGRAVYDRYCYQCHGYAGDARTLAGSYLEPPPRDFTGISPALLTRVRMVEAVSRGRPGTAMMSFERVLSADDIGAVVDFVRSAFMGGSHSGGRYHTVANGWPNHERYQVAFGFATGVIPLETPWEDLEPAQRDGKHLFLSSCVVCHDRGAALGGQYAWRLRAVSYPRGQATTDMDEASGASPYALHDQAHALADLAPAERRGRTLYLRNCAFCHAADGSGRNWIGSFLEPAPRDLRGARVRQLLDGGGVKRVIRDGLPGSTMSAWGQVLSEPEIEDLVVYLRRAFGHSPVQGPERRSQRPSVAVRPHLEWRRRAPTQGAPRRD